MKQAAAIMMVLILLSHLQGLRLPQGDVDRDGQVTLMDAILAVQGLQNATSSPTPDPGSAFRVEMKKTVRAFQAVAGELSLAMDPPEKAPPTLHAQLAIQALPAAENPLPCPWLEPPPLIPSPAPALEVTPPPPRIPC